MKQDQKETILRELFQKLKRDDERQAPPFADVFEAARDRLEERRSLARSNSRRRWSLAAAAGLLIACGLIVYNKYHDGSQRGGAAIKEHALAPPASVKHESEAASRAMGTSRKLRTPRPRRGNRTNLEISALRDGSNAKAKEKEETTDFIPLRYGDDEHMESGDLVRVLMPRSALITLGLPVNVAHADEPVVADLLIGEDGLARAIRFVR